MGVWQTLPGQNVSRVLARTPGVDWVLVDCEHGNIDDAAMHEAVPAIASCGVSPIVRIPDMQGWMIKRALDAGAHGILIPLLRSAEEAKKIVAAAKFPPLGQRGLGSPFAMERFHPIPTMTEYLQHANQSLLTIVQIETQEALDAVEEIAAVPGIDVLFVGPFDLGNNIGHPILDGVMKPELEQAIDRVLAATTKAGKKAGFFASNGEQAKKTERALEHKPQFSRVNRVILQDWKSRIVGRMVAAADMALKCVHQGCGKEYSDSDEVCRYHPGPPVFHEGQKGWKCCKPRFLTFDEFLQIPPCTEGKHSTTDHPPKIEKKELVADVAPTAQSLSDKLAEAVSSTPSRAPLAPQPAATAPPPPAESEDDEPNLEIPDAKPCRRKGCNATYKKGQQRSDDESCVHHPGAPIFHEGSKGYSCCKRRVLEFDQFMKIEGCKTSPRHLFIGSGQDNSKKKSQGTSIGSHGEELLETVRHDFYQTPTTVIASFFLKKIDSARATVEFNPNSLDLDLPTDEPAPKRYKASVPLFGEIDVQKSTFKILGTKLEVSLYKADGASWPVLRSDDQRTGEILQIGRAGRV
ncbi:Pyruvate/Phosphoenolpyruvate kinase-like domain-containing protein [Xylaria bambusicola]|uniref:Pyruvate/Phosphoenolpyruvate kinase-like domain-containing protein n=1 Tax=Xylaria bambusicola TaxID=326684 RepID=UPI0020077E30|nr:Pyruvate/Phosphoenolpyruvate kinase-like domain-containing protein [Xylaria bambusicola]KAI0521422.1 Pyruvate/Phosphoenolpyruvate kinase-like domain-containing protein [Xylaria bambusicola]